MGNPANVDKLGFNVVTGKLDFGGDRLPGRKYFGAVKGATIGHGAIKVAAGGGAVTGITITAGGTGYTSAPTITITGGGGTGATATATVTSGAVTAVSVSSGGTNYGVAPSVTFSGGGGSGAAATAVVSASTPMIDATKALALPGVKAVVTYKNVPTWSPTILFWGQPVLGVVADDWYTAVRATNLITITYDVAPGIFDADAGFQTNAPLSGVYATTNLTPVPAGTFNRGDVNGASGFAAAEVTLDTSAPWTNQHVHNVLEPRNAVAWWINDNVYIWCGSANPFAFKNTVVNAFAMPANKVHFFSHGTGGSLGDRLSTPECVPVAAMSKAVGGYPVHVIYTRKETILMNIRQNQAKGTIKWGAKKDGTIVAASGNWNAIGSGASGLYFDLNKTFTIPNVSWTYQSAYLNLPARGAWRCVADPPGCVISDTALDKLAFQLGMDPWVLRQKNLRAADAPDQESPYRVWGANGAPACLQKVYEGSGYATKWHTPGSKTMADGRLHGIAITGHLDSHAGSTGVARGAIVTMTPDGTALINMGGGRSSQNPTTMVHFTAEALGMKYDDVNVGDWGNTDVCLDAGSQGGSGFTGGAGSATVAAAFDLRNKLWTIAATKAPLNTAVATGVTKATATCTVTNGMITSVTVTNGGSGYNSAIDPAVGGNGYVMGAPYVYFTGTGGQATAVANVVNGVVTGITVTNPGSGYSSTTTVNISGFTASDLDAKDSSVFLKTDTTKTITYRTIMSGTSPMSGTGNGWTWSLRSHTVGTGKLGDLCNVNGSSASCCELLVDPDTGEIEILGHWNAVETGRTVYKHGAQNQIMGGSELQVNQALYFGDTLDSTTGATISSQYTEAQMVTPKDFMQERFTIYDVELDDAAAPFGARGIAEPAVTNYSCIVCAIFNATGKWVDMNQGACNPDRVLKALGKA